jgi:hypothetical protein
VWTRKLLRAVGHSLVMVGAMVGPYATPWTIADDRIDPPPGHPERVPDQPLDAVERGLWAQLEAKPRPRSRSMRKSEAEDKANAKAPDRSA